MRDSFLTVLLVFVVAFLVLYALPGLIEWELLPHAGPWLVCVAFGDLVGCAFLFVIGLRRTAVILYFLAGAFEACLLLSHRASGASLVWITNLLPALAVSALVARLQASRVPFLLRWRR